MTISVLISLILFFENVKYAKDKKSERIDRICNLLNEKWKHLPDQRLGQFLIYIISRSNPFHDSYIFFKEDDEIEDLLKKLFLHI